MLPPTHVTSMLDLWLTKLLKARMSEMVRTVGSSSTKAGKRAQPGAKQARSRLCPIVSESPEEPNSEAAETIGLVLPPHIDKKNSAHVPSMARIL